MNKEIEKLISSTSWQSIQRFQEHTSIAALKFQESEVIRSIRTLTESSKMYSLGFCESELINPPWLESIRRFQEQSNIAALRFQESEAMRSIRTITEFTKMYSLAFNESELMKTTHIMAERSKFALLALRESDAMKSLREITYSSGFFALASHESEAMKSLRSAVKTTRLSSLAIQQSEAFKQWSQLSNLASFQALSNLANSPFSESVSLAFNSEIPFPEVVDDSLIEIDAAVREEISSVTDFGDLSDNTRRILLYLYHTYFLPIFLSCLSAYLMTNAIEARKVASSVTTPAEAKAFVRAPNNKFDRTVLKGFRVTTANNLNFREGPSMKSKVIMILPVGTLVEILDKSHRSWLLVEVEIEGTPKQGWISRRFTSYFK